MTVGARTGRDYLAEIRDERAVWLGAARSARHSFTTTASSSSTGY